MQIDWKGELSKVTVVGPGDVFVLKVDAFLSKDQVAYIENIVRKEIAGAGLLVLDRSASLEVKSTNS